LKVPIPARLSAALAGLLTLLAATTSRGAPRDLYASGGAPNSSDRFIFRFTPDGVRSTFASGLYQPVAIAFDRKANLFVADSGSGIPQMRSFIVKFAPDGSRSTFASLGFTSPLGMTFDGAGNLLVSNGRDILKFAPDGTQSTFASGVEGVWPLAFDKFGNLYAGVNPIGPSSILKFAPDGSSSTFITFPGPSLSTTGLTFDAKGDLFATLGSSIVKVTPARNITTFATGDFLYPLAFDSEGNLFASLFGFNETNPVIVKFAPDGTRTTFAFPPPFSPAALAFEPVTEKLRNLSARGLVGTGDDVLMIGGFIVGGNALANNAVVLRALGPSLTGAGVANVLADPMLELHDASGTVIASNDNWRDTQEAQITASGLAPSDPRESAIYSTLPQGSYTAIVRGAHGTTGTALVEVYSVGQ
jgi:hypothetical protein